jgi:hypothetical protein
MPSTIRSIVLACCALALIGLSSCDSFSPGEEESLAVVAHWPPSGAEAGEAEPLVIVFNNPIDAATATSDNVWVDYDVVLSTQTSHSIKIPGAIALSVDGRVLTFTVDGGTWANDWSYDVHVSTGLKDTDGDGLDAQLDFSFDTFGPGVAPSGLNANGDFSAGMRDWRPEIQGNEGNSSVYWAKEPGTEIPMIVLKRTGTADGGQTGLYQNYIGIEQSYSIEVTVTYKRISGSATGDHRLQVLAWYGGQGDELASNTGFGGGYLDMDEGIDSDWVTATVTFWTNGPRIGAIWITQGGHEFETWIKEVDVAIDNAPA